MAESLFFDVVIVGAGPSGLAAAIRLKQQAKERSQEPPSVCILEKGAEVGAHIISGAVMDPRGLDQLLPQWRQEEPPAMTAVTEDHFLFLTRKRKFSLPIPKSLRNEGNFILSLGELCQWLAKKAEGLGVEIFPGFAAQEPLFNDAGQVCGIKTGACGLMKEGTPGPQYQEGVEIRCQTLVVAEGCRGSLTKILMGRFQLQRHPQTYGLGLKEIWHVPAHQLRPGLVIHVVGYPLAHKAYGGAFLYHREDHIALGLIVGLDYKDPKLSPYEELQRLKEHPAIQSMLTGGKRISYGARAVNEGGYQSIPRLQFPGGVLVGCAAGFLDMSRMKGIHNAILSGILAADAIEEKVVQEGHPSRYEEKVYASSIGQDLYAARNLRPAFQRGFWWGLAYGALDLFVSKGRVPWTFSHACDHTTLKPIPIVLQIPGSSSVGMRPLSLTKRKFIGLTAHFPARLFELLRVYKIGALKLFQDKSNCPPRAPLKTDGVFTFDRLSSVALTNTIHRHDEPCHLVLQQPERAIDVNWVQYGSPEQYYCPAGVYEIVQETVTSSTEESESKTPRLQINGQNCIHCKTCDIKDPTQNITWGPPEGGGGPRYQAM